MNFYYGCRVIAKTILTVGRVLKDNYKRNVCQTKRNQWELHDDIGHCLVTVALLSVLFQLILPGLSFFFPYYIPFG